MKDRHLRILPLALLFCCTSCSLLDKSADVAIAHQAVWTWHCIETPTDGNDLAFTLDIGDGHFRLEDEQSDEEYRNEPLEGSWEISDGSLVITPTVTGEGSLRFLLRDPGRLSEETDRIEVDRLTTGLGQVPELSIRAAVDVISEDEVRFSDAEYRTADQSDWDSDSEANPWVCTRQ